MGLEQARQAVESAATTPQTSEPQGLSDASASASSNGGLAPDSAETQSSNVLDLTKAEKFLWEGKEMTPQELRSAMLRQQDYTRKTQQAAEERRQYLEEKRRFDEERQSFQARQEEAEKFESNLDADIQNVLRDPSLESKFKELYPQKYHAKVEQALMQAFGDRGNPEYKVRTLEQQLQAIQGRFQQQDQERAAQAFESEVKQHSEILDSAISRLASKYPSADEDSVLARAEYLAGSIKKDDSFAKNFSQMMEKLYKENHEYHEKRYAGIYKQKVEQQKQANNRSRDVGRGGATPGTAPAKLKLRDVKNHILSGLDN